MCNLRNGMEGIGLDAQTKKEIIERLSEIIGR